ncbi:beta-3 adrenergic receptor [Biomphalaria glabrata]|nr:beta-3 adrenergic receptor [Biomphalaria glabrata]
MINQTSNNETICSSSTEKFSSHLELVVVLAVFAVLIDVATAYLNLALIIALWRYTDPRCKNKITRIIVSSLSVVDLCVSLFSTPLGILLLINNGEWRLGSTMLYSWESYTYILSFVSALHIFSMALDKYLAICHPTRYRLLPEKLAYFMIFLSWLTPLIVEAMFLFSGATLKNIYSTEPCFVINIFQVLSQSFFETILTFASALVATPIFLSYFLYALILIEIRRWIKRSKQFRHLKNNHLNKSSSAQNGFLHSTVFQISQILVLFNLQIHNQEKRTQSSVNLQSHKTFGIKRNLKAIRTIGLIVTSFTLCWIPSVIFFILISQGYRFSIQSYVIVLLIGYLNSTVNPVLCLGIGFIRSALQAL